MGDTRSEAFIKYVGKTLSKENTLIIYKVNNVHVLKANLFSDFIEGLLDLIFTTYMGEKLLSTKQIKEEHFNWCWTTTVENFKKENITFINNGEHRDYFLSFMLENFYDDPNESNIEFNLLLYYKCLMDLTSPKTSVDLDNLVLIYKFFNKNLR